MRDYFEVGCLCILTGRMTKQPVEMCEEDVMNYYYSNCKCSRHPESTEFDKELEKVMRKELNIK